MLGTELYPLCHPSCATGRLGKHTQLPGQCHTHLGTKQAAVRRQAGSLVAELSREGRGLGGHEVLSDTHCAYQPLHLCQEGGEQEGQWRRAAAQLGPELYFPSPPCPALRGQRLWIQHQHPQGHSQNQAKGMPEMAQAESAPTDPKPSSRMPQWECASCSAPGSGEGRGHTRWGMQHRCAAVLAVSGILSSQQSSGPRGRTWWGAPAGTSTASPGACSRVQQLTPHSSRRRRRSPASR